MWDVHDIDIVICWEGEIFDIRYLIPESFL